MSDIEAQLPVLARAHAPALIRNGDDEPPRVCRRPQLLRGWGHGSEEEDEQQIFA